MRTLLSVLLGLGIVLLITPGVLADDSKAQEIVKEARAAVGGEEQLQKIQSLYISGKFGEKRRICDEWPVVLQE